MLFGITGNQVLLTPSLGYYDYWCPLRSPLPALAKRLAPGIFSGGHTNLPPTLCGQWLINIEVQKPDTCGSKGQIMVEFTIQSLGSGWRGTLAETISLLSPRPGPLLLPPLPLAEDPFLSKSYAHKFLSLFLETHPKTRMNQITCVWGGGGLRWRLVSRTARGQSREEDHPTCCYIDFKSIQNGLNTWADEMLTGWPNGMWEGYLAIFYIILFVN